MFSMQDGDSSFPICRAVGQRRWLPLDVSTPARLRDVEFVRNGWRVFESVGGLVVRTPDGLVLELAEGAVEATGGYDGADSVLPGVRIVKAT